MGLDNAWEKENSKVGNARKWRRNPHVYPTPWSIVCGTNLTSGTKNTGRSVNHKPARADNNQNMFEITIKMTIFGEDI